MAKHRKRGVPITLEWLKSNCIETNTGCWEWTRAREVSGYGRTYYQGRKAGAHRLAYELSKGSVPPGLCVLHKCDNRPCCNPEHLFAGTYQDNSDDMHAKGREARGENHGIARLTSEQVREIRSGADSTRAKAKAFGVSQSTIQRVMTGECWSHLLAA